MGSESNIGLNHLHVRSWFSFLAGGSPPEELVAEAVRLKQSALALTDLHGVYGAVRFAAACEAAAIKPIFGATVMVRPTAQKVAYPLVLLAINKHGYTHLCRTLTQAHANDRLAPFLHCEELIYTDALVCLTGGPEGYLSQCLDAKQSQAAEEWLEVLRPLFPDRLYVEVVHRLQPLDTLRVRRLAILAHARGCPLVATNAVRYATARDFPRYDALTCVGVGVTVGDRHSQRPVNDRACLASEAELRERIPYPEAFANSVEIARLCTVRLLADEVTPPTARLPAGQDAVTFMHDLCMQGLTHRYPEMERPRALAQLEAELEVVNALDLAEFFLVVHEVTSFARSRGIRCAGRGSAANSIIAYVLGITEVDPIHHNLLFERFLHRGRKGMPDIDVDFDSERRDEVIHWVQQRFGSEHAAMTANVNTYRVRGAVRDMMKVLGWDLETIGTMTRLLGSDDDMDNLEVRRPDFEAVTGPTPLLDVLFKLVRGLRGCPRHLSLHSGGMVLSRPEIMERSPIQISANTVRQLQFDKDDVEALGMIKFDLLGLRMLAVVSEALSLHQVDTGKTIDLDTLPMDDEATFELIRRGETMAVFQIEYPGQWNMLSRVQPRCFDDLIVEIALFRPGPLQGGMINPYVERRAGREVTTYLHPCLEPILRETFGVILFQEQVLQVSQEFAGLSMEEADKFRSLMSKWRDPGRMQDMYEKFVTGAMRRHGVCLEVAEQIFKSVASFVGYGFCKSHAAAFARTVYHTAYLKTHYPAAHLAACLQHKPGFYPMHTVLEEARHCGVRVLPVDAWRSGVRYAVEGGAIRMPLTQVQGMSAELATTLVLERASHTTVAALVHHVPLPRDCWDALARAGAFDTVMNRRDALWQVGLRSGAEPVAGQQPLFPIQVDEDLLPWLEDLDEALRVAWDFETLGMSPRHHPIALHRAALARMSLQPILDLYSLPGGRQVLTAGIVMVAQRPPTAKGMRFIVLEDETGRLPVAIAPPVYERYRQNFRSGALVVRGRLEMAGTSYRSVMAHQAWSLSELLGGRDIPELTAAVIAQGRGH